MESFEYVFTALRGKQAGREYYVAMCPLKLVPKIFLFPLKIDLPRSLLHSFAPFPFYPVEEPVRVKNFPCVLCGNTVLCL